MCTGLDHNHVDRVVSSTTTKSNNLADMKILYKDHKPGRKTRPVVTGCSANTQGLTELVANFIESIAVKKVVLKVHLVKIC